MKGKLKFLPVYILLGLLVASCGGGGGGGGRSNVKTPPTGTTHIPSGGGSTGTGTGSHSGGSGETIDTASPAERNFLIGLLDSDFISEKADIEAKYGDRIEILPKKYTPSENQHGVAVLEVIYKGNEQYKTVAASIGEKKTENTSIIHPSVDLYEEVLGKLGHQRVKIFNQSWGASYPDNYFDGTGPTLRQEDVKELIGSDKEPGTTAENEKILTFYKDTVNNKGGLFIWSAGNAEDTKRKSYNNATLLASLPKYFPELEKGWLAVVGTRKPDKLHHSYAGVAAKWAITAPGDFELKKHDKAGNLVEMEFDGSSFSAPLVANAAAHVAIKYPWMSASQVRDTLLTTTDKVTALGAPEGEANRYLANDPDIKYGWGLLNAKRALKGPGRFLNTLLAVDSANKVGGKNYFQARIPSGETKFENDIYGDSGIYKTGTGTLVLSGKNYYTGDSIVKEGTIKINKNHSSSNTTIEEGAKIVLHDKGVIGQLDMRGEAVTDPGKKSNLLNKGTFELLGDGTVTGDYKSDGNGCTVINTGKKLKVGGTATLGANDALVMDLGSNYIGKRAVATTMEAQRIEGVAPRVMAGDIFNGSATTDGKTLTVTLERKNLEDCIEGSDESKLNTAANMNRVLDELDSKQVAGTLTANDKIKGRAIQTLSASSLTTVTDFVSGEVYATAQALTFAQSRDVNRTLSNRMLTSDGEGWQSWMQGMGSYGRIDKSGYARAKTHVVGGQFGLDRKVGNNARAGVAIDYSYGDADFNRFAGDAKSDNVGVSLYGKKSFEDRSYIAGRAGISRITSKVKREILDSSLSGVKGDIKHHDTMLSLYAEFGKTFGYFTPYLGYSYDNLRRGSFSESNAAWGINADKKTYTANRVVLGLRGEYSGEDYRVNGYVSHEINVGNRDLGFDGHFTGSDVMLRFKGIDLARHTTWLGVGAEKDISPSVAITGNLDFLFENGKSWNSIASVGLKYSF